MDDKDLKSIIQTSGNTFHCKVLNYFNEKYWYTLISPYYTDVITDKPREIDIISEKEYDYSYTRHGPRGSVNIRSYNIRLYIECKYISKKVVFWFANKDMDKARDCVLSNTPHKEKSGFTPVHHYLTNEKVAKLFAGPNHRKPENEDIYQALNQCLNARVYNRRRNSILPEPSTKTSYIFEYPVIICNSFDDFYRVDIEEKTEPCKIDDNFQLEVNYAYLDLKKNHRTEYFLIDLVEYNKIDKFLLAIEKEVKSIAQLTVSQTV